MFKFDYRQFEPEPRDLDERACVHWLPFIEAELVNRYRSTDGGVRKSSVIRCD